MNSLPTVRLPSAKNALRTVARPCRPTRTLGLATMVIAAGLAGCGHTPETANVNAPAAATPLTAAPTPAPVAPVPTPAIAPAKTVARIKPARAVPSAPVVAPATVPVAKEVAAVPAPEPAAAPPAPTTRTQAGRILDENGRPLIGATVMLRGSTKGTSTDASGSYSLEVPTGSNTFVVGYGGYEDETATSSDGQPLNVTLLPKPSTKPTGRRGRR